MHSSGANMAASARVMSDNIISVSVNECSMSMCLEIDIGVSTETDHVISILKFRMGFTKLFVD